MKYNNYLTANFFSANFLNIDCEITKYVLVGYMLTVELSVWLKCIWTVAVGTYMYVALCKKKTPKEVLKSMHSYCYGAFLMKYPLYLKVSTDLS